MFCPKCAARNDSELAYCRECGENLKVISQAMKGNIVVWLASKLDAAVEDPTEGFRKDALLWAFWAVLHYITVIITMVSDPDERSFWPLSFLSPVGMVFVLLSGWNYLIFRRSRDSSNLKNIESNPLANASYTAEFCPRCGDANTNELSTCANCQGTLVFDSSLPDTAFDSYFTRRMDRKIERRRSGVPTYRSIWWMILSKSFMLLSIVVSIGKQDWNSTAFWSLLTLSRLASQSWDLLAWRRRGGSNPQVSHDVAENFENTGPGSFLYQLDKMPVPDEIFWDESSETSELSTAPLSVAEAITRPLESSEDKIEESLSTQKLS